MSVSKVIFKCITTWQAIILGNLAILGLLYFSVHSSFVGGATDMIIDLRTEAISSIIIAWGVLLESRELLIRGRHLGETSMDAAEELISIEVERTGIFLVILGLVLEIVTYFDVDVRAEMLPPWIHSLLHYAEWIVVSVIAYELLVSSLKIVEVQVREALRP